MNNKQINKDKHTFQSIGTQQQANIYPYIYIHEIKLPTRDHFAE